MIPAWIKHILKSMLLVLMWMGSPPEQRSFIAIIAFLAYIVDRHGYKIRTALKKIHEELHNAPRSKRSIKTLVVTDNKTPVATDDKKD